MQKIHLEMMNVYFTNLDPNLPLAIHQSPHLFHHHVRITSRDSVSTTPTQAIEGVWERNAREFCCF